VAAEQSLSDRRRIRQVLTERTCRSVLLAEIMTALSDQIARVGVSWLVFERTRSGSLAAVVLALTFLPALLGPFVSGISDRYPHRTVMVTADLIRAVLMAAIAIPSSPALMPFVAVLLAQFSALPHSAARLALLTTVFRKQSGPLTTALSLRQACQQTAQVIGFLAGGVLALITPTAATMVSATGFALSALVLRIGVAWTPGSAPRGGYWRSTVDVAGQVRTDARLRVLLTVMSLQGIAVVPEGIALAYLNQMGHSSPALLGALLAAGPLGVTIGSITVARMTRERQRHFMMPLAVAAGVPLLICALQPGWVISVMLFAASGFCAACVPPVSALVSTIVPDHLRAQSAGLAGSVLVGSAGLAILVASQILRWIGPAATITLAGALVIMVGSLASIRWRRAQCY
jgi:predicted MFS family arabinose efflux permease